MDSTTELLPQQIAQIDRAVTRYYEESGLNFENAPPERAQAAFEQILRVLKLEQLIEAFGPEFLLGKKADPKAEYQAKQGSDDSIMVHEKRPDGSSRQFTLFGASKGPIGIRASFNTVDMHTGITTSGYILKTNTLIASNSGSSPIRYAVNLHK